MCFKAALVILLTLQVSFALIEFDGTSTNVDGFVQRPQKNKAGFGEFPWIVALYKKDSENPHCAGSIIDESTILTTAFCVSKFSNPSELIIRAGIWDLKRTSVDEFSMQQRVAAVIKAHPQYSSPDPIDNDIAVVKVNQPFKFTKHIQKISLDNGSLKVSTTGCIGSGWGAESEKSLDVLSQYLKMVPMDQVDHAICEKQLRIALKKESFALSDSFICAGGNEYDLCVGDSGGSFICPVSGETNKFVLSGVTSYGVKCFTETPGVYTNVVKFVDWIRDQSEVAVAY